MSDTGPIETPRNGSPAAFDRPARLWIHVRAWLGRPETRRRVLPAVVLGAGVVLQAVLLLSFARHLWFVGDDWDFLLTRGTVPNESVGWWAPHNQHWSTVMVLVFRTVFAFAGMKSYLAYAAVQIVMHLGIVVLGYRLLLRLGASPWTACAAAWLVLFMGAGTEALLSTTSLNHTGSLFFGLLAASAYQALGLTGRGYRWIWGLLLVAVAFSASGIPVVCFVTAWVLLDHGWRPALRVMIVPALAHLTWFVLAGRQGGTDLPDSACEFVRIPEFFWTGLTNAFEAGSGIPGSGVALLLALFAGVVAWREPRLGLRSLALAGWIGTAFYFAMVAVFRLTWGLEDTRSGRYVYASTVFLAPAIVLCLERVVRALRAPSAFVFGTLAVVLALFTVNGVRAEHDYYRDMRGITASWPDRVRGVIAAVDAGQAPLTEESGEWAGPTMTAQLLSSPRIRAALPKRQVTAQGRVDAEGMFFTAVSGESFGLPPVAKVSTWYGFTESLPLQPGCFVRAGGERATLLLDVGEGGEVKVTGPATSVTTQVIRGEVKSADRVWPVGSGPVYVGSTARDAQVAVIFDKAGDYTICTS